MADEKPKRTRKRTAVSPERQALNDLAQPLDALDQEINDAQAEDRPIDMERAFPNPPPPLAAVRTRTRGQTTGARPGARQGGGGIIPVAVAVAKGEEDSPETRAKQAARAGLTDTGTITPVTADGEVVPDMPNAASTPADRLNQVSKISGSYTTEFRLRLLHRLLMRNLPMDIIAGQMQMSISTVRDMRKQLYKRLGAEAAASFDMNTYVGKSEAFYNELRGVAMRLVDDNGKKDQDGKWIEAPPTRDQKMRAISTALSVEADRHRFYAQTGVFQAMPFRPDILTGDNDQTDNAARVIELFQAVISGDVDAAYAVNPEEGNDDDVSLL